MDLAILGTLGGHDRHDRHEPKINQPKTSGKLDSS